MNKIAHYLIALADELDNNGYIELADRIDALIKSAAIPFHETKEAWQKYHEWLKLPENWNNQELVDFLGGEWRNCKLCGSTLLKHHRVKKEAQGWQYAHDPIERQRYALQEQLRRHEITEQQYQEGLKKLDEQARKMRDPFAEQRIYRQQAKK